MIIISGIVFIHKEVTSTGEVIIHIHLYDFTQKNKKHHHKSDSEIQYLNVVFTGTYLATANFVFEQAPTPFEYHIDYAELLVSYTFRKAFHPNLRGPPSIA